MNDLRSARGTAIFLSAFVALAGFSAFHWANLLVSPPSGRVAAAVGVSLVLALLLEALRAARLPRLGTLALAAIAVAVALAAGLAAAGVPLRLLAPEGWPELASGLDRGLTGLGTTSYPYSADGYWQRLVLLAALPLGLTAATALACWPQGRRHDPRVAGVAVLVGIYAVAAVLYAPGRPLVHGLVLFLLVAGCLWGPRIQARPALVVAVVIAAGALAVPFSAAIARERPIVNYRSWAWSGGNPTVAFNWNHSYDLLEWPREGTALLEIESELPHYWRAVVLERFDGSRWVRGHRDGVPLELPGQVEGFGGTTRREWVETTRVTVRELRSDLVTGPGSVQTISGLEGSIEADGTALAGEIPSAGQSYEVTSYAPDPTVTQLRAAPSEYPSTLARFTGLELPPPESRRAPGSVPLPPEPVAVPLRGNPRDGAGRRIGRSGYRQARRLAADLVGGAPTTDDAVKEIERHLQSSYSYSEDAAAGERPLQEFLFETRTGYCQQFSGAMALLLRMSGIPARVVSGFSPGAPDLDRDGVFVVRDTDAHSWVEVYFTGIGWVPFDPTPSASPAELQSDPAAAAATPGRSAENPGGFAREPQAVGGDAAGGAAAGRGAEGPRALFAMLVLLGVAVAGVVSWRRSRFDAASRPDRLEALVAELVGALHEARYDAGGAMTLLRLERRLREGGRTTTAGYLSRLRVARFTRSAAPAPGLADRREVRRELGRARGPRTRLRLLLALPPGGPRPDPLARQ